MFHETTCEDLLTSFALLIAPDKLAFMKLVLNGHVENFCSEEVFHFREQFKCRSLLTKDNVTIVLKKVARQELL